MEGHILITGCSGGGKSTLIELLALKGFATVSEPGRRLIAAGIKPWDDLETFLVEAGRLAERDLKRAETIGGPIFFDRGLIDAFAGLERLGGTLVVDRLDGWRPYARQVFIAPPWPEIYGNDGGRRHGFDEALAEYEHLADLLPTLGYVCEELPRVTAHERVEFVLDRIS